MGTRWHKGGRSPSKTGHLTLALIFSSGSPDPFAVVTVDGEQTQTTEVSKKTLNPEWNQTVSSRIGPLRR